MQTTYGFCWLFILSLALPAGLCSGQDLRVYPQGERPNDGRLKDPKDLNGYFPFEVPSSIGQWEARSQALKLRIKVATGLWPMPEKTPLNAVIHGKVQRPGFTVEKVYFESIPGHFVSGLLFRPDDGKKDLKRPAVLSPHGHGGRNQDYGLAKMDELIKSGAEKFTKSGRFPKMARCAQLARMGCVVFLYDMLGYVDSQQISREIAHGFSKQRPALEGKKEWGFYSAQAEMRLQSIMGLQTWNSIRGLDFLEQLPDVDRKRMAVTGGSGGGTQTILLCAIDDRPIAAFPNGMVSTSMQGGCTCENCSLLRVGTGNVELAALFAPKPQAMTAANDWTKEMMTKGYPELQKLYGMYDARDNVACREMLHFPHNFNYQSRLTMYRWFHKHLKLDSKLPIDESDYEPLTKAEYTVWDNAHPAPKGGTEHEIAVTKFLAADAQKSLAKLTPQDPQSLIEFQFLTKSYLDTLIHRELPRHSDVQRSMVDKQSRVGYIYFEDKLRLTTHDEEFPIISLYPTSTKWTGEVAIWVSGKGKQSMFQDNGSLRGEVRRLIDAGVSVVGADLFQQGEFLVGNQPIKRQRKVKNNREFAGYTFGYNDSLFVRRVHDILTLIAWVKDDDHAPKSIHLIGIEGAAANVAAARAIAKNAIKKAAFDTGGFRFADIKDYRDPNFLPGAVKYGDLPSLLAMSAPLQTWLGGEHGKIPKLTSQAFAASKSSDSTDQPKKSPIVSSAEQNSVDSAVTWLLKE